MDESDDETGVDALCNTSSDAAVFRGQLTNLIIDIEEVLVVLRPLYRAFRKRMSQHFRQEMMRRHSQPSQVIVPCLSSPRITNGLVYALSTGSWGVRRPAASVRHSATLMYALRARWAIQQREAGVSHPATVMHRNLCLQRRSVAAHCPQLEFVDEDDTEQDR